MTILSTTITVQCDLCQDEIEVSKEYEDNGPLIDLEEQLESSGWRQVFSDEHWCSACAMEMES